MPRKKQYAPILEPARPPTHFPIQEARRAGRELLDDDGSSVQRPCDMAAHPGDSSRNAKRGPVRRTGKPFRTLKAPLFPPDHFTMEEAAAAVEAVMAEHGIVPVYDVVE
jgi:hypothetical protein